MTAASLLQGVRVAGADRHLLPFGDEPVDVLLSGGRVADIAPHGTFDGWRARHTTLDAGEVIDGRGAWVLPGLWDHHVHMVQWALAAERVPLRDVTSAVDAAQKMSHAPVQADGRRVGSGYRDVLWADAPELTLLDAATKDVPTYLINADVHSVWLNSAALRREGFSEEEAPDGVLREADAFEISRRLNAADPAVADVAVLQAARRAAARGVVGLVDFDMAWNADAWARRTAAGFDTQHVEFAVYPADLERAVRSGFRSDDPLEGDRTGLVRVGALKVISDGSLGTRTAACFHGYSDDPHNHGIVTVPPEELYALLLRATAAGIRVAVHAIGDRALSNALDAFSATGAQGTIEHAQLVRHADLRRMGSLGITASVQPQHAIDDRDAADRLWATQEAIGYPLGSLRAAGIDVQLGSDAPVSPLDPWHAIAAAVHRTGDDRAPWHPEERLDIETALRASAHRGTAGNGGVRLGGAADLVLVDIDPAHATRDELRTMPVRTTLLAGRITHHSARTYGG